jgi:replicative DNA helicase
MILEASSDMVLLLDHSRYERDNDKHIARTWLIVDKNRHGPVGDLPVLWDYRTLRMREGLEDEIDEWPK